MIKVPMDICMRTLDGYINDEDKLVTYKWLSNEMEIHVNVAKQILEEYWNKHKNNGIVATIMLIGFLKGGEMRVELVKECDLATAKGKYSKIISQHIYSLQKTLSDIELLAGVGPGDVKYGAIHCEKSVLFSDEELFARRWGAATKFQAPPEVRKPPVDKAVDAKKSIGIGKFLKESVENNKPVQETVKEKQEEKSEAQKISPPRNKTSPKKGVNPKKNVQSTKAGFSNLFGKVSAANQKKSPPSTSNTKNVLTENKNETMKENIVNKDISAEKAAPEKKNKLSSKEESSKEEIPSKKPRLADEKESPKDKPEKNVEPTSEEKKGVTSKVPESKNTKNKKTKRGTKRERSQESKFDAKKRKRIVVASDTSDESAESDVEVVYDSPPREPIVEKSKVQSPPPVQNINGKRKVLKMVDKTYMDEYGYLVTKIEHVYESCSEEDEEVPAKVPKPKPIVSEPPPRMIKKQTTLTSFFKKP